MARFMQDDAERPQLAARGRKKGEKRLETRPHGRHTLSEAGIMINVCWGWRQLAGVAGMAGGAMKNESQLPTHPVANTR